ncbi:DUF2189 domain-containing protein [Noviherbaspirillum denitrificans]|uniref:Integral membrane protein n=1 Tax=Noviherbaspirillum denitrificans TaxID=1968433 RepID=A0A254TPU8_9BURK|nr:DUF2189 domain-containing protein [Noviherbaspirillum denitrificans]OWW22683.1 hypothetical protein AYR66_27460 [Noviherbaspirillum denitrificans]
MSDTVHTQPSTPGEISDTSLMPDIRSIGIDAPFRWLAAGWRDMLATRLRASFYGLVFVLMGFAIAAIYETQWQLTMGLTAGFFLIGPFVFCGIYWLSRQRERGEKPGLTASLFCWKDNPASIGFFAAILTFFMVIWARVSVVIFALFSTTDFPTMQRVLAQIFSMTNMPFVIAWFGVGFIFASIAFAISVVSVPLMLDRNTDTMISLFTSVRALWSNPVPLYLWAALIVALIGASLLLSFIPLLLTAPLVGHATWHAYRDLVAEKDPAAG